MKIQALSPKGTRAAALIKVLTGLFAAKTQSSKINGLHEVSVAQAGSLPDTGLEELY